MSYKAPSQAFSTCTNTSSFTRSSWRVQLTSKHSQSHTHTQICSNQPSLPPTPLFIHEPCDPVPIQHKEASSKANFLSVAMASLVSSVCGNDLKVPAKQNEGRQRRLSHPLAFEFSHLSVTVCMRSVEIYERFQ